jgi:TATA-box binding protein (TBP) (component of TFIID and TFIIIB)
MSRGKRHSKQKSLVAKAFRFKRVPAYELHVTSITRYANHVMTSNLGIKTDPLKTGEVAKSGRIVPNSFPCVYMRYFNSSATTLKYSCGTLVVIGPRSAWEAIEAMHHTRLWTAECTGQSPDVHYLFFDNAVAACQMDGTVNRIETLKKNKEVAYFAPTVFAGLNYSNITQYLNNVPVVKLVIFSSGKYNVLGPHWYEDLLEIKDFVGRRIYDRNDPSEPVPIPGQKKTDALQQAINEAIAEDESIPRVDDSKILQRLAKQSAPIPTQNAPISIVSHSEEIDDEQLTEWMREMEAGMATFLE